MGLGGLKLSPRSRLPLALFKRILIKLPLPRVLLFVGVQLRPLLSRVPTRRGRAHSVGVLIGVGAAIAFGRAVPLQEARVRVRRALGLAFLGPPLPPRRIEPVAQGSADDVLAADVSAAEVGEHGARVEAEPARRQVEQDFHEGDLAKVEIGGDDLAGEARLPLGRDLAHELLADGAEQVPLAVVAHLGLGFGLVVAKGRALVEPAVAGGGIGYAGGEAHGAVLLGNGNGAIKSEAEAVGAFGLQQLVDAVSVAAKRLGGVGLRPGRGEGGDEGALRLRVPAIEALAALDRGEGEEIAEVGEVALAGISNGAAAVADDWDGAHPTPCMQNVRL